MPLFSVGEYVSVNGSSYRFSVVSVRKRKKRTMQGLQYQYVIRCNDVAVRDYQISECYMQRWQLFPEHDGKRLKG